MVKVTYTKDEGPNINEFVVLVREAIILHNHTHMIVEPGDATRYEMAIIIDGFNDFIFTGLSGFGEGIGVKLSRLGASGPWDFGNINPCSAALASDICNMALDISPSQYFDFEKGHILGG